VNRAQTAAAGVPLPRRRCRGYIDDDTEPSGHRRCPLDLPDALILAGITKHPWCGEDRWCLGCRLGEQLCACPQPRWAEPSLDLTARPSVAERAAALRADGVMMCGRGREPTPGDLDAVEAFRGELARRGPKPQAARQDPARATR
jgi:hypothetical protein